MLPTGETKNKINWVNDEHAMKDDSHIKQVDECVICMTEAINSTFTPCGHRATCIDCGNRMLNKACPICRTRIESVIRTYDV